VQQNYRKRGRMGGVPVVRATAQAAISVKLRTSESVWPLAEAWPEALTLSAEMPKAEILHNFYSINFDRPPSTPHQHTEHVFLARQPSGALL